MEKVNPLPKDKQARKLVSFVRKLGDEEINIFLEVLGALMARVPAPRDARKSYLKEVEVRLRNNGGHFLSTARCFPTFGLKLLGNDRDGFPIPGFKQQKGKIYPKLFAWYWGELDRLSSVNKPSKVDALRAQRVLCVLSFSKMIKTSSINQIKTSLSDFEKRVSPTGASLSESSCFKTYESKLGGSVQSLANSLGINIPPEMLALAGLDPSDIEPEPVGFYSQPDRPNLMETLGIKIKLGKYPKYLDTNSFSCKPSSVKELPRFPEWFDHGGPCDFYYKPPPYGRIHVLTESAGKLRIICPYNTPFVHSTGLYARSRAVLDALSCDYSSDQAAGHRMVQKETSFGNKMCVSADLSNFSDDIKPDLSAFGLRSLGLPKLKDYLFNLPVTLPSGRFLIPDKLLMGLKGCFELSSVCHHYVVKCSGIINYALCGDDLFFRGDINVYLDAIKESGWKLNRSKTVHSRTVAVFCGEMYWLGLRISPRVPKVSTCFHDGKLLKAGILFAVTRCNILHLEKIYNRRGMAKVIWPFLRLLRSRWNSVISLEAPQKLRGLGLRSIVPGIGLLDILSRRDVLRMSKLSIGIKRDKVSSTRWFGIPIQIAPNKALQEFSCFPALLKKGAVDLKVLPNRSAVIKYVSSLDVSDVLYWYYDNVRLEPNQFELVES